MTDTRYRQLRAYFEEWLMRIHVAHELLLAAGYLDQLLETLRELQTVGDPEDSRDAT